MPRIIYKEVIKTGALSGDSTIYTPNFNNVQLQPVVEILKTGDNSFDSFKRINEWNTVSFMDLSVETVSATSIRLTLTFDKDIPDLTADDIVIEG